MNRLRSGILKNKLCSLKTMTYLRLMANLKKKKKYYTLHTKKMAIKYLS